MLRSLSLIEGLFFWQHALMKYAGHQDSPGFYSIKQYMTAMLHAAQAGPNMIAGAA